VFIDSGGDEEGDSLKMSIQTRVSGLRSESEIANHLRREEPKQIRMEYDIRKRYELHGKGGVLDGRL